MRHPVRHLAFSIVMVVLAFATLFLHDLDTLAHSDITPSVLQELTPITVENSTNLCQLASLGDGIDPINAIALDSTASLLVSGNADNTVRIWNIESGQELAVLRGHQSHVTSVAFSPDGTVIISGSRDRTVRIWDMATQTETAVIDASSTADYVNRVAFSPDGTMAAYATASTVHILDTETYQEQIEFSTDKEAVTDIDFSDDSNFIIYGTDGGDSVGTPHIIVQDLASNEVIHVLQGHETKITDVDFYSDDRVVSSSSDTTVRLWNLGEETQERVFEVDEDYTVVNSIAVNPTGTIIAAAYGISGVTESYDTVIRLWQVETGEKLAVLMGHSRAVNTILFNATGSLILSGGSDGHIYLWGVCEYHN